MADFAKNHKNIFRIIILCIITLFVEIFIFNFSAVKSKGYNPEVIATDAVTDDAGDYRSGDIEVNGPFRNVYIEDVILFNAESMDVSVTLTDEGDEYPYDLATFRVIPEVASSGYINLYPYGDAKNISVHITVPEGSAAAVGRITINANKPIDIKPVRMLILFILLAFITYVCGGFVFKDSKDYYCKRGSRLQTGIIIASVIILLILGKWMSVSNNMIVACPWPHHKQYQELAVSLSNNTVKLLDKEVAPELLEKANPYDTIALTAEGIFYNMDYAYYDGAYYVYFGIIPELLLYYPHYLRTGMPLANYMAQFMLFIPLVIGIFLTLWKMAFRFGSKNDECQVPFIMYLALAFSLTLFSNNIYLISRADIYNIPVMAATAFTWLGTGLWLAAVDDKAGNKKGLRIVLLAAGSLSMAFVAGCRPQFVLYYVTALFLFLFVEGEDGKLSIKNRKIFTKKSVANTLSIVIPFVIIAAIVCWYNQARFGSIFEFGATYSLTTNDMNHRGFNIDRLLRGLYSFLFQPAVTTTDFPYLESSVIDSSYMGKNLAEFTYGGCFATNVILLAIFAPLFGLWKKMKSQAKAMYLGLALAGLVIAAFDVNGAGILYRYTCDCMPGFVMAAVIIWFVLLKEDKTDSKLLRKLLAIALIIGFTYSLRVFLASGDSVNLKDNSVVLYECIRSYFRW